MKVAYNLATAALKIANFFFYIGLLNEAYVILKKELKSVARKKEDHKLFKMGGVIMEYNI